MKKEQDQNVEDMKLRLQLCRMCGFNLNEVPAVYRYIHGDDHALDGIKRADDYSIPFLKEEKSQAQETSHHSEVHE